MSDAADANSAASPSQAADAARIGAEPAPVYISAELISGGNTAKFMSPVPSSSWHRNRRITG